MSLLISLLKRLPIDVGQANMKHTTAGKNIAFSFVPNVKKGELGLDIGCRDGYWSEKLKEKGYEIRSLDIDPYYDGAIIHDLERGLPFNDRTFDLIWCTEVIEHLYKPDLLLKEIDRVLKPGGRAILTTPNSDWWFYKVVGLWGWTPQKLQNPDHKQFFKEKDVRKIFYEYNLLGYFPYAFVFFCIKSLIGLLSPTFILVRGAYHD